MFGRKKSSLDITPDCPVFYVRYVGSTETFVASGKGCTHDPVQKVWDNAPEEAEMRRVSLTIGPVGICVRDLEKKDDSGIKFPIEDISYCNADSDINVKIFSWISKCVENNKIKCHVVLCSSLEKARAMALVLSRSFHIAYKDWKADKKRIERKRSTSSAHNAGVNTTDRCGLTKQSSAGCGVIHNGGDNPSINGASSEPEKTLNITHDEDSFASDIRDDESITENSAIIDPTNLASFRRDERVRAVMAGDATPAHGPPTCPPHGCPSNQDTGSRQTGGLVMV